MKEITSYRLKKDIKEKINELKIRKIAEDDVKYSDTDIVEKAIDYYHSYIFGDKVKDKIIELLENEINYAINDSLKNFMGEIIAMFQIMNHDAYRNKILSEIGLKILVSKLNVDSTDTARYALTNNPTVFDEEIENKIKKDLPSVFQYIKKINEMKNKYESSNEQKETEESQEDITEEGDGVYYDADNLPF